MFESVFKAFESFILEFSVRRLTGTILLLIVVAGGFILVDRYAPYFVMGRLERATGLLERLSALESRTALSADAKQVRDGIVRQLKTQIEPAPLVEAVAFGGLSSLGVWKFASGSGLWLLFALVYLPNVRTDPSNWNGVLGAVFVGATWGAIGSAMIPDMWTTWKVLVVYALGNFAFSVVIIFIWQQRQAARSRVTG